MFHLIESLIDYRKLKFWNEFSFRNNKPVSCAKIKAIDFNKFYGTESPSSQEDKSSEEDNSD